MIKYKYNTSMLITVWHKDDQILLLIKNANVFISLFLHSTASDGTFVRLISMQHINVEGKAVSGLPSSNCMASPTAAG